MFKRGNRLFAAGSLALINFLCVAGLAILYAIYQIPPPLISFIPVAMLFLLALLLPRREN